MPMLLAAWLGCAESASVDPDDLDSDGYAADIDCDDTNAAVFPRADEVCNTIDDNCDGARDEGCEVDPNATWTIEVPATYACSAITHSLSVESVATALDDWRFEFRLRDFSGDWYGLYGTIEGDTFTAQLQVASLCVYDYDVVGTFVGPYQMRATLGFVPYEGSWCGDCTAQSWSLVGARDE